MPQKNMPKDWAPPYPSWSAAFDPAVEKVVIAYFAVQAKNNPANSFHECMQRLLSISAAPDHVERATYTDTSGYGNDVYICYWTGEKNYQTWSHSSEFTQWWEDPMRQEEGPGYWREVIFTPLTRLETLLSSEDKAGVAATAPGFTDEIREHAYWGGMRDRIQDSEHNDFQSAVGDKLACLPAVESRRKRIRISPPENMCLIRSAQNWTQCRGEELAIYENDVHPVLIEGMNYIRDNPIDSGCISCRFMDELTGDGRKQLKTFGMAYFLTMGHLESWARSHPSHLAIFQSFHKMVQKLEFQIDLKLWHEVTVLPAGPHIFEYVNCHEKTGLLPYFEDTG